jgi:RNA polymerase-interacting CarD/CdnL/TRCF family regulator
MSFEVGSTVIHLTHGLGEIVQIEEKNIHDLTTSCYVFRKSDLMVWIPVDQVQHSLRAPTPPEEFGKLFVILSGPGEALLPDRELRKNQLVAQMRDGQLESIVRLVRNLTCYSRSTRLNDRERAILERATNSLLTEWSYSLGIPLDQARRTMEDLLAMKAGS